MNNFYPETVNPRSARSKAPCRSATGIAASSSPLLGMSGRLYEDGERLRSLLMDLEQRLNPVLQCHAPCNAKQSEDFCTDPVCPLEESLLLSLRMIDDLCSMVIAIKSRLRT